MGRRGAALLAAFAVLVACKDKRVEAAALTYQQAACACTDWACYRQAEARFVAALDGVKGEGSDTAQRAAVAGRECGDRLKELARRGGSDAGFPEEPALFSMGSAGGLTGRPRGQVQLWKDGTVRFEGPGCGGHPVRGALQPAEVAALVELFRGANFAAMQDEYPSRGADCVYVHLSIELDGVRKSTGFSCGGYPEALDELHRRAAELVGPNPCE